MTLSEEDRTALVRVRLDNAKSTLDDARKLLDSGSLRGAVNRAYYAMFYAASALAGSEGQVFKKHSQLIGFFQKNYLPRRAITKPLPPITNNE